eukprot:683750-Rhodomonas_salina.1
MPWTSSCAAGLGYTSSLLDSMVEYHLGHGEVPQGIDQRRSPYALRVSIVNSTLGRSLTAHRHRRHQHRQARAVSILACLHDFHHHTEVPHLLSPSSDFAFTRDERIVINVGVLLVGLVS